MVEHASSFCLKYTKGKIITADPETLGIFTFKTKKDANRFINNTFYLILKVRPIGKGTTPKLISNFVNVDGLQTFFINPHVGTSNIPAGTICYPAVRMLD